MYKCSSNYGQEIRLKAERFSDYIGICEGIKSAHASRKCIVKIEAGLVFCAKQIKTSKSYKIY